jgi:hypothetical protein
VGTYTPIAYLLERSSTGATTCSDSTVSTGSSYATPVLLYSSQCRKRLPATSYCSNCHNLV